MASQGKTANSTGNMLEQVIRDLFVRNGFTLLHHKEWREGLDLYDGDLLIVNAPFTTIYDHRGKTEFLAHSDRLGLHARIECKWQQHQGSVDEKLPYLYLNCIEAMPEEHIIIVIDGDGFKEGAKRWLREAVEAKRYQPPGCTKRIEVFTLAEFLTWANRTLAQ